jgi:homoserine dehydrogenase
MGHRETPTRVSIVGLGVVGRWVLEALRRDADRLGVQVVAAADRSGLFYRPAGLGLDEVLAAKADGALTELTGVERWSTALEGLREIETDVLVEVSQSPPDGEPGLSHIRTALGRGVAVATSNKWPVALAGVELGELAERNATLIRAESTVMSGTPVLSTLTEGIAGATPIRVRGMVNATANFVCSRVAAGETYAQALQAATELGLAEPEPSADVDGHDSVSKLMVLAALVFHTQLRVADVKRRGLSEIELRPGDRVREVMTLDPGAGRFSVEAVPVSLEDPLARIEGASNAIVADVDPIGSITIAGPGAGRGLAGQGVYSDLLRLTARGGAGARGRRRPARGDEACRG